MMNRTLLCCAFLVALEPAALPADPNGRRLSDALRNGDMAIVRTAVVNDADVERPDEYGNTLLMHAAVFGKIADLEFLLAQGANVNAANQAGHTPLMRAMPDLAKIKALVEHGARINAVTSDGTTPLMMAARNRTAAAVVRYLLAKGADLQATNSKGFDPVMFAAEQGAPENLKILLDAGANGASRIKNAVVKGRPGSTIFTGSVLDLVKRRAEGYTALMHAARADCESCVRLLLERGSDARAGTQAGLTALHGACYGGNPALVKLLLDAGAPINAADDRGYTPLMMAVNSRTKSVDVVRMLLDRGADVRAKDASGRSVAEWAAIGARREILTMMPEQQPVAEAVKTSSVQPAAVRGVVSTSIALLQESGPKFFPKAGCISCHNVSIPMMALQEGRGRGYSVQPAIEQMAKQTVASLAQFRDNLLSGYCAVPAMTTTATYALISLGDAGYAPDLLTDSVVRCLLVDQFPDGHWRNGGGERRPLGPESDIPGTALSARAVQLYTPPALSTQAKAGIASARAYLLAARPHTGDDYAFGLLGLLWTDAPRLQIAAAARELIAQQRADGGWAQTPQMASDAYATGQALTAISMTQPDMVKGDPYRRGVAFLMRTREVDGSWHVRSRAFGFQLYFESGFPHGHDQWISMAATAWAVIALMPAVEPADIAAR